MASSSLRRAECVPRSAPLIDCPRRSRSVFSSWARPVSSWWWTLALARKNFSDGMPVSAMTCCSTVAGSLNVSSPMVRVTVPLPAAKTLCSVPARPSSLSSRSITGPAVGSCHGRVSSSSAPLNVGRRNRPSSIARWTVDLPASLAPRTTFRPGPSATSSARWRRKLASRRRLMIMSGEGDPARVIEQRHAQAERLAQLRRALAVAARLVVVDARPKVARQGTQDGVGWRRCAVGQAHDRSVAQPQAQEGALQLARQLVDVQVELGRAHADDARVEDEVRVGQLAQLLGKRGLGSDGCAVELQPAKTCLSHRPRLDAHLALAAALLPADEHHPPRAVLIKRDRLRGARGG